ncbi:MAG: restriction endonuclease subunit S [Candidatus Heimdallarchaeota archaeon]
MKNTNIFQNGNHLKDTELGTIPRNWAISKLGDVSNIIMGQSPPRETYNSKGEGMPFLQGKAEFGQIYPKHTRFTSKPLKLAKKGTILISVRAPVGDVNVADNDYCIGRGLASISFKDKNSNFFLFFLLTYIKPQIVQKASGLKFKLINKEILKNLKIPLPPFSEQKKIATVLSTVRLAKEKTERVIDALQELKKSMMKHLFTYGPVPLDQRDAVELKETEIGLMPKGWEVKKLSDFGDFQYGYTTSAEENETEYQFLRITDIQENGYIDWNNVPYAEINKEDAEKYLLNEGDILFARIGATTGKTCIIDKNSRKCIFAFYLIRYVIKKELIPKYFFYFTQSSIYWNIINSLKGGKLKTGVNSSQLRKLIIPYPTLDEQKAIANILTVIDEKINADINKKQALEELFRTLLEKLMTGQIRVNALDLEEIQT